MRKIILLIALFFTSFIFSQGISDYRYIVVPKKFSFLKEPNKYNLNSLTKSVLEKQGYEVYYEGDTFPQGLAENHCRALYADMLENNTLFSTKIKLVFKDCKNQEVYVSEEGVSREKELAKAYVQAFRTVGKSLEVLNSQPKDGIVPTVVKADVAIIQAETIGAKLFAQPIANGFQLVDSSPKVVMKLFKTSATNFYLAQKENQQGVVLYANNQWIFEYYLSDKLVSEKLEIKF